MLQFPVAIHFPFGTSITVFILPFATKPEGDLDVPRLSLRLGLPDVIRLLGFTNEFVSLFICEKATSWLCKKKIKHVKSNRFKATISVHNF